MATIYNVYNAKKQQLNSTKLHNLFRFFSNNYNGVVNYKIKVNNVEKEYDTDANMNNVVVRNESNYVTIQASSISMILGGMLFTLSHPEGDSENKFWGPKAFPEDDYTLIGLIVDLDGIQENTTNTILHNRMHDDESIPFNNETSNIPSFGIYRIADFTIEEMEQLEDAINVYKITRNETEGWPSGYRFNAKKFNNLTTDDGEKSGYLIPIAAIDTKNNYVRLLECHSKASFEEFLTAAEVAKLKQNLDEKYVHRTGSVNKHPDYGKIGALNVTHNHLSGYGGNTALFIDLQNINLTGIIKNVSYTRNGFTAVIDPSSGKISPVRCLQINQGGTGSWNKAGARTNLGITSGTVVPADSTGQNGDIFLKIIE